MKSVALRVIAGILLSSSCAVALTVATVAGASGMISQNEAQRAAASLVAKIQAALMVAAVLGGAVSGICFSYRASPAVRKVCFWLFALVLVCIEAFRQVTGGGSRDWTSVGGLALVLASSFLVTRLVRSPAAGTGATGG